MIFKKSNSEKAEKLEAKGDKLLSKGKAKKAFSKFKKALRYDPSRKSIYDKLIESKNLSTGENDWDVDDFLSSLHWTMKKQELENPAIRHVYAKLSPEWDDAKNTVLKIIGSKSESEIEELLERLVSMGEIGTRAAVDMIISIKNKVEDKNSQEKEPQL